MEVLKTPQGKTSRHLGYLRKAGLVQAREEGLWSFYSLTPAGNPVHEKLLDCLSVCCEAVPEIVLDDKRVARIRKAGSCCP